MSRYLVTIKMPVEASSATEAELGFLRAKVFPRPPNNSVIEIKAQAMEKAPEWKYPEPVYVFEGEETS